eukprot:scaffold54964_cov30-Tisochrysis_lutea.AAC.5
MLRASWPAPDAYDKCRAILVLAPDLVMIIQRAAKIHSSTHTCSAPSDDTHNPRERKFSTLLHATLLALPRTQPRPVCGPSGVRLHACAARPLPATLPRGAFETRGPNTA